MRILTHDQLHRTAPAIFANQPDEAVSDRYGFVPTINVVDALNKPTSATPSAKVWRGI